MIKLFNDWVILVDDMNYTLAREMGEGYDKKSDSMKMRYKYCGYYGSLAQALKALSREIYTSELKDACVTLAEAVDIIKEAHAKTDRLLEEVLAEREQHEDD